MFVSMLILEARRSYYLFAKSWSKAGFVNFIRYPFSSLQFRYQLRQRQTSFYTSFRMTNCLMLLPLNKMVIAGIQSKSVSLRYLNNSSRPFRSWSSNCCFNWLSRSLPKSSCGLSIVPLSGSVILWPMVSLPSLAVLPWVV